MEQGTHEFVWVWLIAGAFKLPLSLWGIKRPHPCPCTFGERMILINVVQTEGMCLRSLFSPDSEKPNLTNPLIEISFSCRPIAGPCSHQTSTPGSSFLICTRHWSGRSSRETRTGRSCKKWWISFAGHFCWHLTHEVWRSQLILSPGNANERSRCHPINYNNWTVIQNRHSPPRSLPLFVCLIYFMKFSSAQAGNFFPVFIYSDELNTLLTWDTIHSPVTSDESWMLMKV